MANRHLSRSIVLQTLFECDIREKDVKEANEILMRNATEFAGGVSDVPFMINLLEIVFGKEKEIDVIIEKAAPDWPIEKISVVDRNVLRIGLAELLFANRNEVPAKVAINEAIELAKTFGGESSGKFVNGVLGAVYKELGEPGIDQQSKPKKNDLENAALPLEEKVGAIVYAFQKKDIYIALVHDVFGHWTLSKGGIQEGEKLEDGLSRVIKEELGLEIVKEEKLGANQYVANHPEKGKIRKKVTYYLAESKYDEINLSDSGGLDDARWFKLNEILDLNFYDDILPLITDGVKKLIELASKK